jgi:hypothetical protein
LRARTTHNHAAGPVVKIEALTEWGARVHVEISQDHFAALGLRKDEEVFITPRDLAIFTDQRVS